MRIIERREDLERAILREKVRGTPDIEIGRKYGVSFRYIERVITTYTFLTENLYKDFGTKDRFSVIQKAVLKR
ncbi:MAG: hypothetical protein N3D17_06180, partial [bacterium]|nr:hypothetical protein [bacterium]